MITGDNFKELLATIPMEYVDRVLDKKHDYVVMLSHVFNTGAYATLESVDFSEELEQSVNDEGGLLCDKDDFKMLMEENGIYEDIL